MELFRALGALLDTPSPALEPVAKSLGLPQLPSASVHASVISFQRFPLASVYLGPEGMLGGEARDRIAGFWRVLDLEVPDEPDHGGALLGLLAQLLDHGADSVASGHPSEQQAFWNRATETLLHEHLVPWTTLYLESFRSSEDPFYRAWAATLYEALSALSADFGGGRLPEWLIAAPGLTDPREETSDEFVPGLLAPARTGMILLRDDLARAAHDCGLGFRAGERRYVLKSLLSQDPGGTLSWLAAFAEGWAGRLGEGTPGTVGSFWGGRARATAGLLGELAAEPAGWAPLAGETS